VGDFKGQISFSIGQGRGGGREICCYMCDKLGHMEYECLENRNARERIFVVALVEDVEPKVKDAENVPKIEKSLLLNNMFLKLEK